MKQRKRSAYFKNIISIGDTSKLTGDQTSALDQICEFLCDSEETFAILCGSAGTGKSYMVADLLNHLKFEYDDHLLMTSTTNKAAKQLFKMLKGAFATKTIHSALKLTMSSDGEFKELKRRKNDNRPSDDENVELIVIDEASMTNEQLLEFIKKSVKKYNYKVLFVLDAYQLPPVNEALTAVLGLECRIIDLRDIVRQSRDSDIIKIATSIRDYIDGTGSRIIYPKDSEDVIVASDLIDFKGMMQDMYSTKESKDDVDYVRSVAWRNVSVGRHNAFIRRGLYGSDAHEEFLAGERCVLAKPLMVDKEVIMSTDTEVCINAGNVAVEEDSMGVNSNFMAVTSLDNGSQHNLKVVHSSGIKKYKAICAEKIKAAKHRRNLWHDYWSFVEGYTDLRYCHAITTHRSQGSTFNTTFVDLADILANHNHEEALRCAYVAITRSSERVIIRR